jgi:cytochrome c oxidase subunit II
MRLLNGFGAVLAAGFAAASGSALAGQPVPWQMGLQPAATPIMEQTHNFHNLLLVIITLISVFVLVLMLYTAWRFSAKRNPVPSKTTHNTAIEMLWTVIPVVILVVIAVPSFKLLYAQDVIPEADMTVKTIGHQWYWSYEYPDHGDFRFDSLMVADADLKPGQPRLLETDTEVVIPVNTTVRLIVTASDVIHAWAIPAFGVKIDAVPGRLNETWFRVLREGTFYGQCSELCGTNHAFMPIKVRVVSKEAFEKWVEEARQKYAAADAPARNVALAAAPVR